MKKHMPNVRTWEKWVKHSWVQWMLAALFFFFVSWFYMGPAITHCSTYTVAFNSDSSGGIAWFQWASGNKLNWTYTTKSNYPYGENLNRPQEITSQAFDAPYRLFSVLSSPICGLNLLLLFSYMS